MSEKITMGQCRKIFGVPRPLRGSERLTKEIRDAAVTYQPVIAVRGDGTSILDCGHVAEASTRNPAELGQMRFCKGCTDAKLAKTGDL